MDITPGTTPSKSVANQVPLARQNKSFLNSKLNSQSQADLHLNLMMINQDKGKSVHKSSRSKASVNSFKSTSRKSLTRVPSKGGAIASKKLVIKNKKTAGGNLKLNFPVSASQTAQLKKVKSLGIKKTYIDTYGSKYSNNSKEAKKKK